MLFNKKSFLVQCISVLAVICLSRSAFAVPDDFEKADFERLASQRSCLSAQEVTQLFRNTVFNKVATLQGLAGEKNMQKYDPSGEIGFCYGRAVTAQLIANRMGLSAQAVRKLFIVGDLRQRGAKTTEWRFHVTTLVPQCENGRLIAIDPITYDVNRGRPYEMKDWINYVRKTWDTWNGGQHHARLFVTPATAVLPDIRVLHENEVGDKIIELNFDPNLKGISESAQLSLVAEDQIFELSPELSARYFLTADEDENERFHFKELSIRFYAAKSAATPTPIHYDYHGYFTDLMDSLKEFKPFAGKSNRRAVVGRSGDTEGEMMDNVPLGLNWEALRSRAALQR